MKTLGRYASNPNLSFTWYDAAVLSQRIRQEVEETEKLLLKKRFGRTLPLNPLDENLD